MNESDTPPRRSGPSAQPPALLLADQPGAGRCRAGVAVVRARYGRDRPGATPDARKPDPLAIDPAGGGILPAYHYPPKAKRVIYLFMSGGPSQLDLFDYKPLLNKMNGQDLPESVRMGQRLTGMSANQATLAAGRLDLQVRPARPVGRLGQRAPAAHGAASSTSSASSARCTPRRSTTTRRSPSSRPARQIAGRPSMGSWLSYGLGSTNENLPAFGVLISQKRPDQPLYARLWGNGFLPSVHQGVQFRAGADPVLYLENPPGVSAAGRRKMLDRLARAAPDRVRRRRSTRRSRPGSPSTRWPTGCRRPCPR